LNGCKDNEAKAKTKEINDGPVAGLSGVDDIGSHAKPDQYGRGMCRLGHSSARASRREAFLAAGRLERFRNVSAVRVKKKRQIKNPDPVRFHRNGRKSRAPAQPTRPMSRLFPAANSEPA
jgi:hypothetical protein